MNDAGLDDRQQVFEVEPEDCCRMLALNLDHHHFSVTQAAVAAVAARGGGSVIMPGSIPWMRGRPGMVGNTNAELATPARFARATMRVATWIGAWRDSMRSCRGRSYRRRQGA